MTTSGVMRIIPDDLAEKVRLGMLRVKGTAPETEVIAAALMVLTKEGIALDLAIRFVLEEMEESMYALTRSLIHECRVAPLEVGKAYLALGFNAKKVAYLLSSEKGGGLTLEQVAGALKNIDAATRCLALRDGCEASIIQIARAEKIGTFSSPQTVIWALNSPLGCAADRSVIVHALYAEEGYGLSLEHAHALVDGLIPEEAEAKSKEQRMEELLSQF